MKIHALIHASFEEPGAIKTWALKHHHIFDETHTYRGESLPAIEDIDLLVVMGGPQSAGDGLEKYPYLIDEIDLIQSAIKQQKKILGVCLGAQLIAEALGVKTQKSPHKEVGMYPVEVLEAGLSDPVFKRFPQIFDAMHWHGDMPAISAQSVLLAKSKGCPHQAFRYGDRVYGLQFHLELTRELVAEMIIHCAEDLTPGQFIHSKEALLKADFEANNEKMYILLDYLADLKNDVTAKRKLCDLQKRCEVGDVISPLDETWEAEQ